MKDLAQAVEEASRRAGDEICRWYKAKNFESHNKADSSPVTSADLASHQILSAALLALTPEIPVISEESGQSEASMLAVIKRSPEFWLVDPLDGTRDFLAGSGEFCTCVALVRAGRPVLGVIHEPLSGRTFMACDGKTTLKVRKPSSAPLFLISRQHPGGEEALLRRVLPEATTARLGSALKYVRIAAGVADASVRFTPTSLWDIAAGQAILEAAGGGIKSLAGGFLDYSGESLLHPPLIAAGDLAMLGRAAEQLVRALD